MRAAVALLAECDDCMFVISFGGASITNGPHTIGVAFFDGETELAADAIPGMTIPPRSVNSAREPRSCCYHLGK